MRIAILVRDPSQMNMAHKVLTSGGHVCQLFDSGKKLQHRLQRDSIDMLILDWQVTDMCAGNIVRWVRNHLAVNLPVLFIANYSDQNAIAAGLAAGANDYLLKPLRRGELAARVLAQLRRSYPEHYVDETKQVGDYVFDIRAGRLLRDEKIVVLTQKEFDLALFLFNNVGRPLSRATIHEAVWPANNDIPSRTLDTHVSRIRTKLQLRPENGFRLAPVYSYGYLLEQISRNV